MPHVNTVAKFSLVSLANLLFFVFWTLFHPVTPPTVIKTSQDATSIRIYFDQPVSRKLLIKSIAPDIPGTWVFEEPILGQNLYKNAVFYTDAGFATDTTYTVTLSRIENVIQTSKPQLYTFSFKTPADHKNPILSQVQSQTVKLPVPSYLQQHTLSCEVASLRMTLAYKGINVSEETLLSQVGIDNTPHIGSVWGNPYEHFVGDVNGNQMRTGYGVYWGPIERVAKLYGGALAFENGNIQTLTQNILLGNPIIVWVYSKNGTPTHWKTPNGTDVFAVAGEHTVVVVGFVGTPENPTQIVVNDSLSGQSYWSRDYFDGKWATFSQSGVIVYK